MDDRRLYEYKRGRYAWVDNKTGAVIGLASPAEVAAAQPPTSTPAAVIDDGPALPLFAISGGDGGPALGLGDFGAAAQLAGDVARPQAGDLHTWGHTGEPPALGQQRANEGQTPAGDLGQFDVDQVAINGPNLPGQALGELPTDQDLGQAVPQDLVSDGPKLPQVGAVAGGNGNGHIPEAGAICLHELGLKLRVIGLPAVTVPGVGRVRCEVIDAGNSGLDRGKPYTFRADRLTRID